MLVVLVGKSCSGKTKVQDELVKLGWGRVVTYTSRPRRKGEKDGITYHYLPNEDFEQKIANGFFAEYKQYDVPEGKWYYGTAKEDLIDSSGKKVIILTPQGVRDLKPILDDNTIVVYLYADIDTIRNRLVKRGDTRERIDDRMARDSRDFKHFALETDRVVYNNEGDEVEEVAQKILKVVNERFSSLNNTDSEDRKN